MAEVAFPGRVALWRCVVVHSQGCEATLHALHAAEAPPCDYALRSERAGALVGLRPAHVTVTFSRDALVELVAAQVAAHAAGRLPQPGFATRHLQAHAAALPPPDAPAAALGADGDALLARLNAQQAACVRRIAAGASLTLCLGPPGTGKTRTVAAVAAALAPTERVLVCAAANVAALNVLRALLAAGVPAPRLLVSRSYYIFWHEHEYDPGLFPFIHVADWRPEWRSVPLPPQPAAATAAATVAPPPAPVGAPSVLICTFGMLRRACEAESGGGDATALLVDESSQAWSALSYAFDALLPCLRRLHLFGDAAQLPPSLVPRARGADAAIALRVRSLYDAAHAAGHARAALTWQYRMPPQLAAFLSRCLYDNALMSAPRGCCDLSALRWRDVPHGRAAHPPSGSLATSWRNDAEVDAVVAEMDAADAKDASDASRVVLTPYLAQRAAIEAAAGGRAAAAGGRWEVKSVDSFQGREAAHVILSLVRTAPGGGAGFLADARRANVALSRAARTLTVVGRHATWAAMADAPLMRAFAAQLAPSAPPLPTPAMRCGGALAGGEAPPALVAMQA